MALDRDELERLTRSTTGSAGMALRARIVLLAAQGTPNWVIADKMQVSRPTVNKWRMRYQSQGLAGLSDEPRPGPPRQLNQRRVIAETLTPPPVRLGVTHWTSRLRAGRLGSAGQLNESPAPPLSLPRAIEPYGDEANKNVDDKTECDIGERASRGVDDGYHNLGHEHPD